MTANPFASMAIDLLAKAPRVKLSKDQGKRDLAKQAEIKRQAELARYYKNKQAKK